MNHSAVKDKLKRVCMAFALAGCMGAMGACGGESGRVDPVKEWVYVPEFVAIEDENVRYYDMRSSGDALYYSSYSYDEETGVGREVLCRYSLTDKKSSEVALDWGEEQEDNNLDEMVFAADGSMCAVVRSYSYDEVTHSGSSRYKLAKFSADGKLVFFQDVTETLEKESQNDWIYIRGIAVDDKGRIYLAAESDVFLFDGDGSYKGIVSVGNGMNGGMRSIGSDRDGKVYVSVYSYSESGMACELTEIDFDNRKTGASYADFPNGSSEGLTPGAEAGTFIVNDGSTLYEYSLETQTKTALFDWLDSDINGSYVQNVSVTEDGRILAVIYDWDDRENSGIAYLTRTKGSEVAQKETILIGTLYNARALQSAAVNFNRNSDKYHITIKQ